jgi:hypothetical protein
MTGDQYVAQILEKYRVQTGPNSPAERAAKAVAPTIRQWARQWLSDLSYSGSYAKGTAVATGTDVDLFISLSPNTPDTLKEIYESLYDRARNEGWSPRRQNVSIGISYGNVTLDLVPGRIQSGYQNVHSLYRRKTDSWTQTNVSLHIDTVRNSGRTREIRAVKIWRDLHQLDFPSFYLELIVIEALKYRRQDQLAANVLQALNYIGSSLPNVRIVDPANTNNVVSDDLTSAEKNRNASQARQSAKERYWEQIIW